MTDLKHTQKYNGLPKECNLQFEVMILPREVVNLLKLEQAAQLVGFKVGAGPHQVEVHAVGVGLPEDR